MKQIISLVLFIVIISSLLPAQWTKQSFPSTEYLWKVRFATEQTGWIAGHNYIYKTTNGGGNWSKQDTSIGHCDAMYVLNDQVAMFANWNGGGEFSRGIRRTTDGGATWSTANSEKNYYADIDFGSANVGYASGGSTAAGNKPIIKKTTDAGATWTTVSQNFPKTKNELTGIAFVDENVGWTVSYDGFVYNTTNGGTDWTLQDSLGLNSYRDVDFVSSTHGWIVGGIAGDQKFARTTNGGQTWIKYEAAGSSPREVEFLSADKGWYVGMNNGAPFIAKINGDGQTWTTQSTSEIIYNGFESIDMVNENIGWAVGVSNIYKFNSGAVSVSPAKLNTTPTSFALEQNFPNPFNPSTTIQFSVPKQSAVSLTVYDVSGVLIDEIVHQTLDAGTYSIRWNAIRVPSGMYFYKITADNFSETKKLILLK